MMTSVDVTGSRFLVVDSEYACIYAPVPRVLGDELVLEVWGLLLRTAEQQDVAVPGLGFSSAQHSVFVRGWAQLCFAEPSSLQLSVALYDESGTTFRRNETGETVCIEHHVSTTTTKAAEEYVLGGHILWPDGDAQLVVGATGATRLLFRPEDCMTATDFERVKKEIRVPTAQ